jgi:hypothetical protein
LERSKVGGGADAGAGEVGYIRVHPAQPRPVPLAAERHGLGGSLSGRGQELVTRVDPRNEGVRVPRSLRLSRTFPQRFFLLNHRRTAY